MAGAFVSNQKKPGFTDKLDKLKIIQAFGFDEHANDSDDSDE
jgi:hypothetical protein